MANEVSTETKTPEQLIKEKIQAEYVRLIPEEMWDKLIQKGIDDLMSTRDQNGYAKVSTIDSMVRKAIADVATVEINKRIDALVKPEFNEKGEAIASSAITRLIEENFDKVWLAMQHGFVDMMINASMQNLRQALMNKNIFL